MEPSEQPNSPSLRLVRPSLKYAAAFCDMAEEFQKAGDPRYECVLPQLRQNFSTYLARLKCDEDPHTLPPGRVPQSEFWLVDTAHHQVLGAIRFRHALNARLEAVGGHIGYAVRPSQRCRGYGKRMLALLLARLKKAGWQRVLITCDADNLASAHVIEANGGCLEDQRLNECDGKLVSRYWITLDRNEAHVSA